MGVDLRLLPFDCDQGDFAFSHSILNFDGSYEFYDRINKLPQMPVPKDFTSFCGRSENYDDTCYGRTVETPYGEHVKFALAGDLAKVNLDGDYYQQKATQAYLKALPPHTKVALYWH